MSTFDNLETKSDEELVKMTLGMDRMHPTAVAVERILELRNARRQVETGAALVRATQKLVNATRWLAAITLAMFLTAAAQVYLIWNGMR